MHLSYVHFDYKNALARECFIEKIYAELVTMFSVAIILVLKCCMYILVLVLSKCLG